MAMKKEWIPSSRNRWDVIMAESTSDDLIEWLHSGWEPFAVTREEVRNGRSAEDWVWLRAKLVPPTEDEDENSDR
jgi:hypothetical protein